MKQCFKRIFVFFCSLLSFEAYHPLASSADSLEEFSCKASTMACVDIIRAKNAQELATLFHGSKPEESAYVWDCDETLVTPVRAGYSELYSTEMYREFEQHWRRVGTLLENENPFSFLNMSRFRSFANACEVALRSIETTYDVVDPDLTKLFSDHKRADHVVCTGLKPFRKKVEAVHEKLWDFSKPTIEFEDEMTCLFGHTTCHVKVPGWMVSSSKAVSIKSFIELRSMKRAEKELSPLKNVFFIDNNLGTLKNVQNFYQNNPVDDDVTLKLIHFTKVKDKLEREFMENMRAEKMAQQYKKLIGYGGARSETLSP